MSTENKQLSDAESPEEFKALREAQRAEAAEPAAEKAPQAEEAKPVIADAPGAPEKITQEKQEPPAEKSVDEQVRELRAKSKHAAANKLMVEAAVKAEKDRADKLQADLDALRSKPVEPPKSEAKPVQPPAPQAVENDAEPLSTDEKYSVEGGWSKYQRDMIAWSIRNETRVQADKQKQAAFEQRARKALETGAAAYPDFSAVTERVVLNKEVLRTAVDNLDNVGEVLYKIGTNPAELQRLQSLNAFDQYAELRAVSHSLKAPAQAAPVAPPEKLKPPVSQVAPPPRTLTGASEAPPPSLADSASYEEFKRNRKLKRAG